MPGLPFLKSSKFHDTLFPLFEKAVAAVDAEELPSFAEVLRRLSGSDYSSTISSWPQSSVRNAWHRWRSEYKSYKQQQRQSVHLPSRGTGAS